MNCFKMFQYKTATLMVIAMFLLSVTNGYFLDYEDEYYEQDPAEDRTVGELPKLNITTYLNIAMEPHNAMVQVRFLYFLLLL